VKLWVLLAGMLGRYCGGVLWLGRGLPPDVCETTWARVVKRWRVEVKGHEPGPGRRQEEVNGGEVSKMSVKIRRAIEGK
jgi:hypothetical protein